MAIQIDGDSGVSGVNGSATTPALQGTDSNTGIVFGTDEVQIATGGSTRATVDSSGRVGIATTPEAWSGFDALEVNEASIVSSGSGDAFFTANAYYDGAWKYKDAGVARNIYMNADGIVFRTAASGSADAAITWTEVGRWREGGGLTFGGDTAAVNALSDYEEGTWSANLSVGTCTTSDGKYIKIGKLIRVSATLSGFTDRSSSLGFQITNAPFAGNLTQKAQAAGANIHRNMDGGYIISYMSSTGNIEFYAATSGSWSQLAYNDLNSSSSTIYFFAQWQTN